MVSHSPTPWSISQHSDEIGYCITAQDAGRNIRIADLCGSFSNPEVAADAKFIVRACNAHDEMLEALRGIEQYAQEALNDLAAHQQEGAKLSDAGRLMMRRWSAVLAIVAKAEGR